MAALGEFGARRCQGRINFSVFRSMPWWSKLSDFLGRSAARPTKILMRRLISPHISHSESIGAEAVSISACCSRERGPVCSLSFFLRELASGKLLIHVSTIVRAGGRVCRAGYRGIDLLDRAPLSRFAAPRDRDPGRDALIHGGALTHRQLGGCSRLAVFDKARRGVSIEDRRPLQDSNQLCAK